MSNDLETSTKVQGQQEEIRSLLCGKAIPVKSLLGARLVLGARGQK